MANAFLVEFNYAKLIMSSSFHDAYDQLTWPSLCNLYTTSDFCSCGHLSMLCVW